MASGDDPREVARAARYLESLGNRARAEDARARLLAGSRTARADLADRWSPKKADRRYPERAPLPVPAGAYPATYPPAY